MKKPKCTDEDCQADHSDDTKQPLKALEKVQLVATVIQALLLAALYSMICYLACLFMWSIYKYYPWPD